MINSETPSTDGPMAAADKSLTTLERGLELFQTGGPVVAILLAMSVIALTILLVKIWQFRAARVGDLSTAYEALALHRDGRASAALAIAQESPNPASQAVARALRGHYRKFDEAMVREEVAQYGADVLHSLRAWFRPLEVIASLAPLLGLFGTVLGMIEAFRQLEEAGNQVNPAILSGGIWEALLTTAVGLAVAIPVVVALNWLERRVDRLAHTMYSLTTRVFTEDLSSGYAGETFENASREPVGFTSAAAATGD
jgi:biopolymer transport protein ExbB